MNYPMNIPYTMNIPIVGHETMRLLGETDTVRIPDRLMDLIGVEAGDTLRLANGQILFAAKAFPKDAGEATAFVSKVEHELSIGNMLATTLSPNTMTIGCDPEFILLDKASGEVVDANEVFIGKGPLGCDAGLAEIRPAPCLDPAGVVKNIRKLLYTAQMQTRHLPIACSSYKGWMAGFHIHFGFPKALLLQAAEHSREFIENAILVLDYLVGIPAMLRDNSDSRRTSCVAYGRPGDYRISENTLEYRVPGGFHLRCPRYSLELMTAAYIVMEDIIGRARLASKYWSDMSKFFSEEHFSEVYNTPDRKTIADIMVSENRTAAVEEVERIRTTFENSLYGYSQSKHLVDSFLSADSAVGPFVFDNWLAT